jgi:formylglycine-generating enzyme required for sulfatase activity
VTKQSYNLANIRDLLVNGFTDEDLRRLCFDVPDFRPVYHELARGTGKAAIVDRLLEHAETRMQIPTLLALAEKQNPARYEHHGPYYVVASNGVHPQMTDSPSVPAPSAEGPKSAPKDDAEREQRLEQLYLDGLEAFWVKEWDKAVRCFRAVVAEQPDYQDAADRLREAECRRGLPGEELLDLYFRAGQAIDAEQWAEAQQLLLQVQERQPGFRQTERMLARAAEELKATPKPPKSPPPTARIEAPIPGEVRLFGGVEMVYVPEGKFWMGSEDGDPDARGDEKPQHEVYLDAFWIDRTPVTNGEYGRFVEATGQEKPKHWQDGRIPEGKEDHPVIWVSWYDAQDYCRWRGEQAGVAVRLPTEAEWEKAARGTDGQRYPWGNEFDREKCNSKEGGSGDTTPVGRYSPACDSPYGLADMAGNVWEWCNDWYDDDIYRHRAGQVVKNPEGPASGDSKMLRGGAAGNDEGILRCAYRNYYLPDCWSSHRGFRTARDPSR